MASDAAAVMANPAAPGHALTFERFHQEYRPRIHRYLTRLVGALDAEDLTQLVFLKASQALPAFRRDASLGSWIYRIARNAAADWRRTATRAAALHAGFAAEMGTAGGAELSTPSPTPDDALIRREMQQCLRGVVHELPDAYQNVLTLRELDGLSNAAIAEVLGLSLATVKVRLHRARGQLRDVLAARCHFSRDGRSGLACERKGES